MSTSPETAALKIYPGLGLPLRHFEDDGSYPSGAHTSINGSTTELLYIRELAMLDVMEKLTDKPDWHKKVLDEEIVSKWREEALAIPDDYFRQLAVAGKRHGGGDDNYKNIIKVEGILDEHTMDTCIQELRSKAKYFEKTGIIPVLDACASAAKSDSLVTAELQQALREAFDRLKTDTAANPDWHPWTNNKVLDLVHPSMYPLVYGRSRVFKEECVGVEDAIEKWAGKGDIIDKETSSAVPGAWRVYQPISNNVPPNFWSETYQWLPSNIAFQDDGSIKFTSYINNLHPGKYPEIYRAIESLIQTALPMWDQCLSPHEGRGAGRKGPRIDPAENPDDEHEENWLPNNKAECAKIEMNDEIRDLIRDEGGYDSEDEVDDDFVVEMKWHSVRKPVFPPHSFEDVDYTPKPNERLAEVYRKTGLQVIVKLASIELTPENPDFPVGGWHVEGQMNEHICGTALYYLDSENITSSNLSFRMQTDDLSESDYYMVGQQMFTWLEGVHGTSLQGGDCGCLQNYGQVETRQGRLLAFPNVFHHRVSPFKLIDPTKPGHRRFIALWLVNPNQRIISTANVPPQQMNWYAESLLGGNEKSKIEVLSKLPAELVDLLQEKGAVSVANSGEIATDAKLPAELMEMVRGHFKENGEAMPMTLEEAKEHREKLMKERSSFQEDAEQEWQQQTYNFCEH